MSNTLKKDPEMKKKLTNWMNRNPNCSKEQAKAAIPELANYGNQSIAQTFNRHLPNAERIWASGGVQGKSQFKQALEDAKHGGNIQSLVDGPDDEDSDDDEIERK